MGFFHSAALCLATLTTPLAAQELSHARPVDVMNAFAANGYLMRLETDGEGDPMLRGRMAGVDFVTSFYGCEGAQCTSVMFTTFFTPERPVPLAVVNAWNADRRFGKAYIDDEGDLGFEMNVNLFGGVSEANPIDTVDWWRVALTGFLDHIGW